MLCVFDDWCLGIWTVVAVWMVVMFIVIGLVSVTGGDDFE
jgi:hypothetical protein